MFGLDKRKPGNSYVVPANSKNNIELKPTFKEHITSLKENHCDRSTMNKCPHCENMAKNFLYLESLIRNNCEQNPKCNLCQSSLKYLQYVNRNIMQVFGNFDSIVQAARVFSTQAPPIPKYSVKKPQPKGPIRSEGGAVIKPLKSSKSLKVVKSQKSKKSIKSSKSGKSLTRSKGKSGAGSKSRSSHGKMVLKSKFKMMASKSSKLGKKLSKALPSASQYKSIRSIRSKLGSKANKKGKKKLRLNSQPTSINWGLLKRNMPKRTKPLV